MDVWVVRYNEEAPLWYWGLKQLPESEVARIAAKARGLLFLDGPDSAPAAAIQDLLYWFPQMPADKLLQVSTAGATQACLPATYLCMPKCTSRICSNDESAQEALAGSSRTIRAHCSLLWARRYMV